MKKRTQRDYTTSLWLQGAVLFPTLFVYLVTLLVNDVLIVGLLFQFFLGVTQLLSGLRGAISFGDTKRVRYLVIAVGYVLLLIAGASNSYLFKFSNSFDEIIALSSMILIPMSIAIWYYYQTWQDRNQAGSNNTHKKAVHYQEDLLDDITIR